MHVLLVHQLFSPPDQSGGARHHAFARRMIQEGHRFTAVASNIHYPTDRPLVERRGLVVEQDLDGIRLLRAYTYPSLQRGFVWRVVAFFSFMLSSFWAALRAGPVDLVMSTSPPIFQALSAWLVSVIRRRPFLLEIRDLWPEFAIDIGVLKNPVLIFLSRWLERFLYARATHILVNSPAYSDYLIQKGIAPSKVSLIPNGADLDLFDPHADGARFRGQWGLDEQFVVTYAGALGLANDIPTILRAADRLRDQVHIHFLLAGDGMRRAELETLARRVRLPNVTFTGSYPKSQMWEVLAASDVCVATLKDIPMFRTTYPNKVFDYMAAGRPTVLAIDGVIRQVVEAAGGGVFVPPGDDAALADAVRDLSQDPGRAAALGRAARVFVEQHFDRQQHAAQFVELVQGLLDRRKGVAEESSRPKGAVSQHIDARKA